MALYSSPIDVGDEVPSFNLDSQVGRISFHDVIDGKWCLFVTFGSAFDPVPTTDFGAIAKLSDELESRNIFVIALGNDNVANIRKWARDIEELQTVQINFAIMSDPDCAVLKAFGCARESIVEGGEVKVTSNGAFLIDIDKRIRFSSRCSPFIGRNWYEVIRQYDALSLSINHRVVCPSNWGQGQEVMLQREITTEEASNYRYVEIKPWFKLTPCPE